MHTGEEWFQLNWEAYVALGVLLLVYLILVFADKLPRMSSLKDFLDAINSAGGHIVILSVFTAVSIKISMQLFYHLLGMGETVSKFEAIANVAVAFVTGGLTGQFLGALLKTMSGGKANGATPPTVDVPVGVTVSSTPIPAPATPAVASPAPATSTSTAPTSMGFAPNRHIGEVGERGNKGDLGTNNRTGGNS